MTPNEKREWATALLQQKAKELDRLPKKDDFDDATKSRIKAYLGPWPRALETAGLKETKQKPVKNRKKSAKVKLQNNGNLQKSEKKRAEEGESNE